MSAIIKFYNEDGNEAKSVRRIGKKCACNKNPSFGFPGTKTRVCCAGCKEFGMVNVSHKKCPCNKEPSFALLGNKPSCCLNCKSQDMVNVRSRCECGKKRALFALPGYGASCCSDCKKPGMVNIRSNKCKCGKVSSFAVLGEPATCCVDCKKSNMVPVRVRKCKSNERGIDCPVSVSERSNKTYDGFCTHCFANLFPSDPRTGQIRLKSKEIKVVNYLADKIGGFVHDKPLYCGLEGGCCTSKRRIDLRKLIDSTMLCIEIDEDQHKRYIKVDENQRYNDLFMDFSGKYIFIRYNPDPYLVGKLRHDPYFHTRMKVLECEIEKQTQRIQDQDNTDLVEIINVYYDQ